MVLLPILERSMERISKKQEIRKEVYGLRRAMTKEAWEEASAAILNSLQQSLIYQSSKCLYCYVDYNHEVGTGGILEDAWKAGKKVYVPKVLGKDMEFFEIKSFSELEPGCKGILEPKENPEKKASGEEGLMILPGVAFDERCHRIGYGGGFYDRYLAAHPNLRRIALAFSYQIYKEVVWEEFDISPEIIITEDKIYGDTP